MTTQADIKLVIDQLHGMELTPSTNEVIIFNAVNMLETLGNELDRVTKCAQHSQGLYERERDKYDQLSNQVVKQAAQIVALRDALIQLRHKVWKQSYPAEELLCNKALAIPTDSTQIFQEWLDEKLGEPVAYKCYSGTLCYHKEAISPSQRTLPITPLFKKPEKL